MLREGFLGLRLGLGGIRRIPQLLGPGLEVPQAGVHPGQAMGVARGHRQGLLGRLPVPHGHGGLGLQPGVVEGQGRPLGGPAQGVELSHQGRQLVEIGLGFGCGVLEEGLPLGLQLPFLGPAEGPHEGAKALQADHGTAAGQVGGGLGGVADPHLHGVARPPRDPAPGAGGRPEGVLRGLDGHGQAPGPVGQGRPGTRCRGGASGRVRTGRPQGRLGRGHVLRALALVQGRPEILLGLLGASQGPVGLGPPVEGVGGAEAGAHQGGVVRHRPGGVLQGPLQPRPAIEGLQVPGIRLVGAVEVRQGTRKVPQGLLHQGPSLHVGRGLGGQAHGPVRGPQGPAKVLHAQEHRGHGIPGLVVFRVQLQGLADVQEGALGVLLGLLHQAPAVPGPGISGVQLQGPGVVPQGPGKVLGAPLDHGPQAPGLRHPGVEPHRIVCQAQGRAVILAVVGRLHLLEQGTGVLGGQDQGGGKGAAAGGAQGVRKPVGHGLDLGREVQYRSVLRFWKGRDDVEPTLRTRLLPRG